MPLRMMAGPLFSYIYDSDQDGLLDKRAGGTVVREHPDLELDPPMLSHGGGSGVDDCGGQLLSHVIKRLLDRAVTPVRAPVFGTARCPIAVQEKFSYSPMYRLLWCAAPLIPPPQVEGCPAVPPVRLARIKSLPLHDPALRSDDVLGMIVC